MFNETLLEEGYAQVATFPPNVKYQERFLEAQREAREAKQWAVGALRRGAMQADRPGQRHRRRMLGLRIPIRRRIGERGERCRQQSGLRKFHLPGRGAEGLEARS